MSIDAGRMLAWRWVLEVGRIIGGKYRLVREVGQGRTGSVWAAQHQTLGRAVALKFLYASGADAKTAARFAEEAKSAARVKHRFVVDVFDFGITEEGVSYMVQELLEGHELSDCMRMGPAWHVREVVEFVVHGLGGLEAVHRAGIVHRDLKPENVFVIRDDDQRYPKLLAFGFSRLAVRTLNEYQAGSVAGTPRSGPISRGSRIGTPSYMSPELLKGRPDLDGRSDLYSIGVILYQWLTGLLPYAEEDASALAQQIASASAAPLSLLRPDLGQELAAVIARALAPEPADRFASATEMREALTTLLPSLPDAVSVVQEWATGKVTITQETRQLLSSAATSPEDDGEEVRLPLSGLGALEIKPWMLGTAAALSLFLALWPWVRSSRGERMNVEDPARTAAQLAPSSSFAARAAPVAVKPVAEPLAVAPAAPVLPLPSQDAADPAAPAEPTARTEERPRELAAPGLHAARHGAPASGERRRSGNLTVPRAEATRAVPAVAPAHAPAQVGQAEAQEGIIHKLDF